MARALTVARHSCLPVVRRLLAVVGRLCFGGRLLYLVACGETAADFNWLLALLALDFNLWPGRMRPPAALVCLRCVSYVLQLVVGASVVTYYNWLFALRLPLAMLGRLCIGDRPLCLVVCVFAIARECWTCHRVRCCLGPSRVAPTAQNVGTSILRIAIVITSQPISYHVDEVKKGALFITHNCRLCFIVYIDVLNRTHQRTNMHRYILYILII